MSSNILTSDLSKTTPSTTGRGDFILTPDHTQALIFSEDMILKTLNLSNPQISEPTFADLEDETYACCSSQDLKDFYLFGGDGKTVQKCYFEDPNKNLTMIETKGNVNHLDIACSLYLDQKFFSVASEDNKICLYDLSRERSFFPKEGECHEASCVFTKISPRTDFVSSLANDGSLCLYKIKEDKAQNLEAFERLVLEKKFFFTNDLKGDKGKLKFSLDYLVKDGDFEILVSGKETLQKLVLGEGEKWSVGLVEDVSHSEKIVNVVSFNYKYEINMLVTVSIDKKLKIWANEDSNNKNNCVGSYDLDECVQKIIYDEIGDQ